MPSPPVIMWFRQDLRLADNPALFEAARHGQVLPIYILDDDNAGPWAMGGASRWWLHESLKNLQRSLDGKLRLYSGDAADIIDNLVTAHGIEAVYWNRCYEPWRIARDKNLKQQLQEKNIECKTFNGSLLWEPWDVKKDDGSHYKVFTPYFKRGCLNAAPPRSPLPTPPTLSLARGSFHSLKLNELCLLPSIDWHKPIAQKWQVGEAAAHARLKCFLDEDIGQYKKGRDFPALDSVSRLSPHLHFGEISPHQVWEAASRLGDSEDLFHFKSELAWREFSHTQLYFNPELPRTNLQRKFDLFPWRRDAESLRAWQRGRTGIPIVDAGMRELWQTGYMHNRVRMIVGSFLVKNLLLHWHDGADWFWDCLLDADLANNSASWQWIAGCGADAAPYFRIFNPVTQGEKFDQDGAYTRHYVPELAQLPGKYLFKPWEAPVEVLNQAGVRLGETYPEPIVDLKASRERALTAFKSLREA